MTDNKTNIISPFVDPSTGKVVLALRIYACVSILVALGVIVLFSLNICEFFGITQFGWNLKQVDQVDTQQAILRTVEYLLDFALAVLFVIFTSFLYLYYLNRLYPNNARI